MDLTLVTSNPTEIEYFGYDKLSAGNNLHTTVGLPDATCSWIVAKLICDGVHYNLWVDTNHHLTLELNQ